MSDILAGILFHAVGLVGAAIFLHNTKKKLKERYETRTHSSCKNATEGAMRK